MRVDIATKLNQAAGPCEVAIERTDGARTARPHGTRFGTLVHAILARVPFDADAAIVNKYAATNGRLVGAPAEETAAASAAVSAALRHPLIQRAAAAAEVRRETPLSLRRDDGSLVEGVVDLAFREVGANGASWTVVDFKTDADLEFRLVDYQQQLSWYAAAITAATGEPTLCALLSV
jgi:ATP-dependent exoDNAse (exonuclease V) beta subunit